MENVFITGAGGFIGRHLVAALLKKNKKITALMMPNEPVPEQFQDCVRIITGDVRDLDLLSDDIGNFDTIFHLAAIVSDWGAKHDHIDITVHGTEKAIALALRRKARFVVTTSIAAFASNLGSGELDETCERGKPASSYEYVKQIQEDLTLNAVALHDLDAVIIRPANVYGVGSVWVNRYIELLTQKKPALMGDGKWDAGLVHVHNLIQGMVLAAQNTDQKAGEIYVLADDPGVTWLEYVDALSATLNLPNAKSIPNFVAKILAPFLDYLGHMFKQKDAPVVTNLAYRLTGVESVFVNNKAKTRLGYSPDFSLDDAMSEIKQHYQAKLKTPKSKH